MKFRTTLLQNGKTATGIRVPEKVVESLGSGKRPAVSVTIKGHTYRSTVAVMGGVYMVGVSAENREKAQVSAGDEVEVDIEARYQASRSERAFRLCECPPPSTERQTLLRGFVL